MRSTFPVTWADARAGREDGALPAGATEPPFPSAPEFFLLDTSGPRPEALFLSVTLLGALLSLAIMLDRPMPVGRLARTQSVAMIYAGALPMFEPENRARQDPSSAASSASAHPAPTSPPIPLPAERSPQKPAALADALPLTPENTPKPTLAAFPLAMLAEREATLAAGADELTPDERRELPRVSIRVNGEWLEALPQTQEKLYFSILEPEADSNVLTYLPASRRFASERPSLPLWEIRDAQQVPALAALRAEAAGRLGVSPEVVRLYTWHPPALEMALRVFILERMQQLGVPLGPGDLVIVAFAPSPDGCVMKLETIRSRDSW